MLVLPHLRFSLIQRWQFYYCSCILFPKRRYCLAEYSSVSTETPYTGIYCTVHIRCLQSSARRQYLKSVYYHLYTTASYLLSRLLGGKHLTQEIKICHISEKKQPYLYSGTYSFGSERFLNKTQRLYSKTPGALAAKGVPTSAKQYIFPDCVFALSLPAGTAMPFSRNV